MNSVIELNIYGNVIRDTCRPRPKCAREVLKHLCTADNATSPLAALLSRIKYMHDYTQQVAKCVLHSSQIQKQYRKVLFSLFHPFAVVSTDGVNYLHQSPTHASE